MPMVDDIGREVGDTSPRTVESKGGWRDELDQPGTRSASTRPLIGMLFVSLCSGSSPDPEEKSCSKRTVLGVEPF